MSVSIWIPGWYTFNVQTSKAHKDFSSIMSFSQHFLEKTCSCGYHIMCTVCNLWLKKTRKNSDGTAEYNSMFVCYMLCREVAIMSQHQVHPPSIPLREFAAWLFISKKRLINYQCYWSSIALNKNLKGIGFKGTVHEKNHPLATHHNVRSLWWQIFSTTWPLLVSQRDRLPHNTSVIWPRSPTQTSNRQNTWESMLWC